MRIDSSNYNGACSCGRSHIMHTELSVIESGALFRFDKYLSECGIVGKRVAVYDKNTYAATRDRHPRVELEVVLDPDGLHANEHGVELLLKNVPEDARVLVAIGSGTIHDITRYVAYTKGIELVSCPTAASVDGFCSSVAAMTWGGCKKTLTAVAPKLVVADLDVIKNAPLRLAKSGLGDMLGKYIALTDWQIGRILKDEYYCQRIVDIMSAATEAVMNSAEGIIKGDEGAYLSLTEGLLLSGLAMQMIGNSRPASGAEHHISHIIEMSPEPLAVSSDNLHGEKVGVGTLLALSEYKRVIAAEAISFKDYREYTEAELSDVFSGSMLDGVIEENKNDSAASISAVALKASWGKICDVIAALPEPEELLNLYQRLGILATLADIGVREDAERVLLYSSPMVRNRLTLMRLMKCIDLE